MSTTSHDFSQTVPLSDRRKRRPGLALTEASGSPWWACLSPSTAFMELPSARPLAPRRRPSRGPLQQRAVLGCGVNDAQTPRRDGRTIGDVAPTSVRRVEATQYAAAQLINVNVLTVATPLFIITQTCCRFEEHLSLLDGGDPVAAHG